MKTKLKSYKKEFSHSYVFGASPTIELLSVKGKEAACVYMRTAYSEKCRLTELCQSIGIPAIISDKAFNIAGCKDNCYVFGVVNKYEQALEEDSPHIVLVSPSDMGNLGTIIRTAAGLGIKNIAVIEPAADIWNPKTIRASMGAFFHIRHRRFASIGDYISLFPSHLRYAFMCDGTLTPESISINRRVSLIFGNEAAGLDSSFSSFCNSVKIPFNCEVDSFNLSCAVAIGAYIYSSNSRLIK